MKHNDRFPLLFIFLVILLTGCQPCTEQLTKDNMPDPLDPIDLVVVDDLRPELTWDFVGCIPEEYEIKLFTKSTNGSEVDTGLGGFTGSSDKNWTPSVDLTVGTHYIWQVAAKAEGAASGYFTPREHFVVGPACESPALIAPDPVWPIGRIEYQYWFVWDYADPTCTPAGYAFQLSRNPEFTDLAINVREANPILGWYDYTMLSGAGVIQDICTKYYWRAAAIDGPNDGPWSEVVNYYIDKYGQCPHYAIAEVGEIYEIPELAPFCGDGEVNGDEQCDGDDLTMCLSSQVCENCKCITHIEAELEFCVYEALQNSNCRVSDFPESDRIEILMEGDSTDLVALNPEYTHGLFELENGKRCWIWLGLMGGPENPFGTCRVEIIDPPEPVREPTGECHGKLDERSCIAAGGEYAAGVSPPCICPKE